jgi:diacylglycerol kinase (ATP)
VSELTTRDLIRQADCLVVANPAAAAVTPAVVTAIEERLERCVRKVRTVWTSGPRTAGELIDDAAIVVAVGGDGTVADLLPVLAPWQVLCVLPAGSGNSTARNLYGDRTWSQVLDLLADPDALEPRRLDLLHLVEPDALALLGASTGFLADVLIKARAVDPAVTGLDRYYAAAPQVLQDMPSHPTRVSVDGVVLAEGPMSSVAVGGGRFRARSFQFLPRSVMDDGLIDVSAIAALDERVLADVLALLPSGDHVTRPEVSYGRGRRVVVERTDGLPLMAELDGSVWDAAGSRLTVDVVPGTLSVLAAPEGALT